MQAHKEASKNLSPSHGSDVRRDDEEREKIFDQKDDNLLNGLLVDDKRQIGCQILFLRESLWFLSLSSFLRYKFQLTSGGIDGARFDRCKMLCAPLKKGLKSHFSM